MHARNIATGIVVRPTITTSASPDYSAGDAVGGGVITVTGVMPQSSGGLAYLRSLTLKDTSGQAPALSFLFFRATPTGGTYTDNSALDFGSTDVGNLVGVVRIAASDWYTVDAHSLVSLGAIDILMVSNSADLYMLIVADATWNASATTNLSLELGFERK